MSEKKPADDSRAKFQEALKKKQQKGAAGKGVGPDTGSKVGGMPGNPAKRFQRKSGSA